MHKTPFAGLTAPDPNDPPLQVDGGSFATRNPDLIDHFLRIGAVTHVHDGHPPLPDPVTGASATVDTSAGSIPSGRDYYIGFTLLDNYGGETLLSPPVNVSTPEPLAAPSEPLVVEFEPDVGNTVVGSYAYAITLVDEAGGETMIGPATRVQRPAGTEFGQFNISGLAAELGPDLGASWRLWRSDNGGAFHIIAAGDTDTFTDDGINPTDLAASPPTNPNATRSTNSLVITMPVAPDEPGLAAASATSGFRVYISEGGAFVNPSLYGEYPVGSAGAVITASALDLLTGAPPDVSTSIPGATPIEGGGGGGGLFTYPATYSPDFAHTYDSNAGQDEIYFVNDDDSRTVFLLDRSFYNSLRGGVSVGSAFISPSPDAYTWTDSTGLLAYMPDAPGMREGDVTVKFEFDELDADIYIYLLALIGAPGRPHFFASVNPYDTGTYLEVGVAERTLSDNYETVNSFGDATVLTPATPYWLRLTRDGMDLTCSLYAEDPVANPSAVPMMTTTGTLTASQFEWAFRENAMPGFGWFPFNDTQERYQNVKITGLHARATEGGDGSPELPVPRMRVFDHGSEVGTMQGVNFEGDLLVRSTVPTGYSGDYATVSIGLTQVYNEGFDFALGSTSYAPQQNIEPWDGSGEIGVTAAGDDGRLIFVTPVTVPDIRLRSELEVSAVEAGDVVGLIQKALDIDDFLVAQVDNATGTARLQIGSMDADVFTELAGVDIPDLTGRFWLRFEWADNGWDIPDELGVVLYTMSPYLTVAAPVAQVAHRLTGAAKVKFGGVVPNMIGARMVSAAAGTNALRISSLRASV